MCCELLLFFVFYVTTDHVIAILCRVAFWQTPISMCDMTREKTRHRMIYAVATTDSANAAAHAPVQVASSSRPMVCAQRMHNLAQEQSVPALLVIQTAQ